MARKGVGRGGLEGRVVGQGAASGVVGGGLK
jgi:hypothetical protein